MLHVVINLFAYVRGCATNVQMELESEQDTGLTEDESLELQGGQFASVLASGSYPHLARMVAAPDVDLDLVGCSSSDCSGCSTATRRSSKRGTSRLTYDALQPRSVRTIA